MKVAIRYFSKTGNTEKLAKSIEKACSAEAKTVETPLDEKVDVLFLCNSVYWAGADKRVKDFIENNADKIGKIVNVSTAALISSTYKQIKAVAEKANVKVDEREFHTKGSFAALHKGRPNEQDLASAAEFARKIINE